MEVNVREKSGHIGKCNNHPICILVSAQNSPKCSLGLTALATVADTARRPHRSTV